MNTTRTRKQRSDKGRVLPTDRDPQLVRMIGECGCMRVDHFCYEMGKYRDGKMLERYQHTPASPRTAADVIDRLVKLRFVECEKLIYGEPAYVWDTVPGLRFAGLPYTSWRPRAGTVAHPHEINRVRIWLEQNRRYHINWLRLERAIQHYEERTHYPDAEIDIVDLQTNLRRIVGIEVERIQKSAKRLDLILPTLAHDYDTIWYFVAKDAWTSVEKAIARLPEEDQSKFRMKSLNDL